MNDAMSGGIGLVIMIFLFVLAILCFLLPFAIFGTKDKLGELISESKKTNQAYHQTMKALQLQSRNQIIQVKKS